MAAEVTVKGTVEDLKPGPQQGVHILLKSSDATLQSGSGSVLYQTENRYEIGRRATRLRSPVRRARSTVVTCCSVRGVKKGSETMTFRDAKGFPMWAGRGAR